MSRFIYMDNAASSFPKPPEVTEAMVNFMKNIGANPGRSGHTLSVEAGRIIHRTRGSLAELFGVDNPLRIILCKNATEALNIAIFGILKPGDHAITTSLEHNSVMRPLRELEKRGLELTVVPCSDRGELDPDDVKRAIKGNTKLVVMVHGSNVVGSLLPVGEVGRITEDMGIPLLVDASQTAGAYPIDVQKMCIDLLAFTGHKSLFGPQGTGGLYIREGLEDIVFPIMMGGTGSRSEFEEQPDFLPDKYESGTPNTVGISGLGGGVRFILEKGVESIRDKEKAVFKKLLEGLNDIDGVSVYGPMDPERRISIVSFNIKGLSPSQVAFELEEISGILGRSGLHCAPSAHRTIGTYPSGTMRLSPGYFNTLEEVDIALDAVKRIVEKHKAEVSHG